MSLAARTIAFVTPWFSRGNGGAEVFCGGLARALADAGHPVEILTTCCPDPFTDWGENKLKPCDEMWGNVTLRRFRVRPRNASTYARLCTIVDRGGALTAEQEKEMLANGIDSPDLTNAISVRRRECLFFFMPYMYGTTLSGVRAAGANGFLIPCLHDEPFAYLPSICSAFEASSGALFLSPPERDLASAIYDLTSKRQFLLGGGLPVDVNGDAERFRQRYGISQPFILYAGRKVPGKGADLLLRHFERYIRLCHDDALHLVMTGAGDLAIPNALATRVHSIYADSARDVHDAMAASEFLVQPSFYESFSLVLMEAWLTGKPVLVNGQCDVTTYHALASNGGLYFSSFGEFCETMHLLRLDAELRRRLGQAGRRYVLDNFAWPQTVSRFEEFLLQLRSNPNL